jgi:hypothetical protein
MPIRSSAFTLECGRCKWSHTFSPRSDVLVVGLDIQTNCPRCGAKELIRRKPTLWEGFSIRLKEIVDC